jgi:DNA-binding Lrp family transcriptional regulator
MNIVPKEERNKRNRNTNEDNKNYVYYDSTIDKTNLKIIKQLIDNPNIKSSEMAEKLHIPLSTIQRRKAKIEELILKKNYFFNFNKVGYRTAEIFMTVENGKVGETATEILKSCEKNALRASSRINEASNLCIEIIFRDSQELHQILEKMRTNSNITHISFSEVVNTIADNTNNLIMSIFNEK